MVYTTVEADSLPPEVVVVIFVLHDDLHPSQSMNHILCPKVDHMHDSLCLHAPPIYKRNNIGWLVLMLSSTCSYILHANAHRLDICDTMVHCCNLMGSVLLRTNNFGNYSRYLWCVHLHEIECTEDHRDPLSPS